ncbi:MAG: flagellar biosynthetic protein FliO [Chlamydiota bacterium]
MWKKTLLFCTCIFSVYAANENKEVFIPDAQGNLGQEMSVDAPKEKIAEPIAFQGAFLKMLLSLGAVILLLLLSFWALKKLMRNRRQGHDKLIHIIEQKAISPKTMLYLLEIDNEKVLIAESQIHVKKIHSLSQIEDDPKFLKE